MAHYPGPWRIEKSQYGTNYDTSPDEPATCIVAANGKTVCCNTTYYPTELAKENAPIISAAPEMLALLKSVVLLSHMGDGMSRQVFADWLLSAREIITKSESKIK